MKIHEYQAIELFKEAGIPVADGAVAVKADEAAKIAEKIGYPVVLKSQVLVGGRGKAGGIKVVHDQKELKETFGTLKHLKIKGYRVEKILVARALNIKKEFYCGITIDRDKSDVVLMASQAGGVDIEETARANPVAIKKYYLKGKRQIDPLQWTEFISSIFKEPSYRKAGTEVFKNLIDLFFEKDCSLVEINPLVIDAKGLVCAADAKINFDDNALFRHEDIEQLRDLDFEDPDELQAREESLSFVKLDGTIGCIVNGAGLAMATMDVIKLLGGQPANFLDVGGSSNPQKVLNALAIILKNKKVKAILINIFGGITRCDDIAQGILEAKKKLKITVPLVVRLTGTNEREARELLTENKMNIYSSMREAVSKVVELAT